MGNCVSQHLHTQFPIGNTIVAGLAIGIRLKFEAALLLLTFFVNEVHDDGSVAHGLTVVSFENDKVQSGDGAEVVGGYCCG
jgi:hypothetical protein